MNNVFWLDEEEQRRRALVTAVIGAASEVRRTLGPGFRDRVYRNALAVELRARELRVAECLELVVKYQGRIVGEHVADLLVADAILVQVHARDALRTLDLEAARGIVAAARLERALCVNFGAPKLEYRRVARP